MKRTMKIIGMGFVIGILMLIVQNAFSIPDDIFLKGYSIVGLFVIVGAVLFNLLYNVLYNKKIQKAIRLLKDGKPKAYIEQINIIKEKAKGKTLRRILEINLSAGYYDLKEYDKAIALLEPLAEVKLRDEIRIVWFLNLCLSYFYVQQNEKAMALYSQNKNKCDKFKRMGKYTENIMLLEIFVALEKNEIALASELIEGLEKQVTDESIKEELLEIKQKITCI